MRLVPGGVVDPAHAVGRDAFIKSMWRRLEAQHVILDAERRSGKTVVLHKMQAEPADGWLPVYSSLEAVRTVDEFVTTLLRDLERQDAGLVTPGGIGDRMVATMQRFGVTKIATGAFEIDPTQAMGRNWTVVLTDMLDAIERGPASRPLLLWDEFPQMLDNISRADPTTGPNHARQILDVVRARANQPDARLRLVLCGSLGLHHVIRRLAGDWSAWSPVNNIYRRTLGPLGETDGRFLSQELLAAQHLPCTSVEAVAAAISDTLDAQPFYIQVTVAWLDDHRDTFSDGNPISPASVDNLVTSLIESSDDPYSLSHLVQRIEPYHGTEHTMAIAILDCIGRHSSAPLTVDNLQSALALLPIQVGREHLLTMLDLLARDHYVTTNAGGVVFRTSLIRRFWIAKRRL